MRSQILLLPALLAAPTLASNPHNLRNLHNRRQDVTIQTNTDATNGFITTEVPPPTVTTTEEADTRTLTWITAPSDGPTTVDTATATVTTTSTTGSGAGQVTGSSSSNAGGARITGFVGAAGVGAMGVVVGLMGL